MRWIEAFPTQVERASQVSKALLKEIVPRFHLLWTLQSDYGPAFISQVTQGVTQALGIKYHLRSAWRSQSSSKVERTNQAIQGTLAKLCEDTSGKWTQLLPTALLRIRNAPRAKIHLSPFEMLYGRSFLSNDLVTNPETDSFLKYIMDLGTFQ
jgi:hypothetical protein